MSDVILCDRCRVTSNSHLVALICNVGNKKLSKSGDQQGRLSRKESDGWDSSANCANTRNW
eukprot:XP_001706967.1 Hypothetical protein GL50803_39344 [Giardia lamblia ATCC 50803]